MEKKTYNTFKKYSIISKLTLKKVTLIAHKKIMIAMKEGNQPQRKKQKKTFPEIFRLERQRKNSRKK